VAVLNIPIVDDPMALGWRAALAAAVAACVADDRALLDDAQLAEDLAVIAAASRRLEAASVRLVAEQVRRRPSSAFDVTRTLKRDHRLSGAAARRIADAAVAVNETSAEVGAALDAGEISAEHLRTLHGVGASLPASAKQSLLADARREDPDAFKQRVLNAVHASDRDDGKARAARQHAARTASWRERSDGLHEFRALLAPDDASLVRGALQQMMDARWRAEHPGRNPVRVERDGHGTRLADAFVHLARGVRAAFRAATHGHRGDDSADDGASDTADDDGGMAPPWMASESRSGSDALMLLLTDVDTLRDGLHDRSVHEDAWGTALTPETLGRLSCDCEILPLVMNGASVPLDAGRRRRLPTATQRAAVIARDRHCQFIGCRVPAAWCQVHHIVHWTRGGSTNLDNLILLCHEDHHRLHEGGWNAIGPADRVRFVNPSGEVFTA
jgi:hypothetical protein